MCNAIGQMAADFAPTFQKKFHDKIVPAILLLLDDSLNPRVQAHAGKVYCYLIYTRLRRFDTLILCVCLTLV